MSQPVTAERFYLQHYDRECAARQTLARLRPSFPKLGISRLGELTGLDHLGIPVAMAVRPNSHSLSVSLGKGPDRDSAMISAAMEAAETAVAETVPDTTFWASEEALRSSETPTIDFDSVARCHPHLFAPTDTTAWTSADDLITGQKTYVPWSLIGQDHRIAPNGFHDAFYVTSDGLASGNNHDEAVFHALCELIERDALARIQFMPVEKLLKCEFRPNGQESTQLPALLQLIDQAGLRLRMFQIDSDTEMPIVMALLEAKHNSHNLSEQNGVRCGGCCCHPDRGRAMVKAITEAAQARLALVAGARDDIRSDHYDTGKIFTLPVSNEAEVKTLISPAKYPDKPSSLTTTLADKIDDLVSRLRYVGIEQVLVVNLDSEEFGIHVVRVVATGLQVPLSGHRVQITPRGLHHMQKVAA